MYDDLTPGTKSYVREVLHNGAQAFCPWKAYNETWWKGTAMETHCDTMQCYIEGNCIKMQIELP